MPHEEEHQLPEIGEAARTAEYKDLRSDLIEIAKKFHDELAGKLETSQDKPEVLTKNLPGGEKGRVTVKLNQESYVYYEQGENYDESENEDMVVEYEKWTFPGMAKDQQRTGFRVLGSGSVILLARKMGENGPQHDERPTEDSLDLENAKQEILATERMFAAEQTS